MLKTPTIVLNVKTYSEATGRKAVDIGILMDKISKETGASMGISVQATDIVKCVEKLDIPVFAEHIDPIKPGSHTGWTLPEAVKQAGAVGTLINHSEHRLILADIDVCINRAKELSLDHIVCSNNVATSKAIAVFSPNFIAIEPPELIGGDISVTTADPDIVSNSIKAVKEINTGKSQIEVLDELAAKNPSLFFRRAIWQIVNGMKAGSNMTSVMKSLLEALSEEQVLQIQKYGSQLSPLAMFYMLVSVIVPALGITFIIVLSSFISTSPTLTKMIFYGLYGFIVFSQIMFLGLLKSRRPNLLGD